MQIGPELWIAGLYGLILLLAAVGQYLNRPKQGGKSAPVLGGVGLELGNRAQMDMLIAAINRIGDIMENKRQTEMEETLEELVTRVDAMMAKR